MLQFCLLVWLWQTKCRAKQTTSFTQKWMSNNTTKHSKPHPRVQARIKYNESFDACNRTCALSIMWFVCAIIWTQNLVTLLECQKRQQKKWKIRLATSLRRLFNQSNPWKWVFKIKKLNVGFITVLPVTSTLKALGLGDCTPKLSYRHH